MGDQHHLKNRRGEWDATLVGSLEIRSIGDEINTNIQIITPP